MKLKFLFSIKILFFTLSVSMSQSIQVLDIGGNDVSSSEVNVWGDSSYYTQISLPLDIKNISGTTIDVKVKKIETSVLPGSSNYFCFNGYCYLSGVYVSPSFVTIDADAKDTTFSGDYKPKGNLGVSIITYVFFREDEPDDSAYVVVQYHATPAGINQYSNKIFEISAPYPNPASSHIYFNYCFPENSKAEFILSDIAGNIIKEIPVNNIHGTLEIPTDELSNGMYFYSFYLDGKLLMTKKLIKA